METSRRRFPPNEEQTVDTRLSRQELSPSSRCHEFIPTPTWLTFKRRTELKGHLLLIPADNHTATIFIDPEGLNGVFPNNNFPIPYDTDYCWDFSLARYVLANHDSTVTVQASFSVPVGFSIRSDPLTQNHLRRSGIKLPRSQVHTPYEGLRPSVRNALRTTLSR